MNEATGEVYGHVVSVDTLGEAYVMPIQSTLLDIRTHLRAHEVCLPSKEEVFSLRDLQEHAGGRDHPSKSSASWSAKYDGGYNSDDKCGIEKDFYNGPIIQDTHHQSGQLVKRKAEESDREEGPKKSKIEIKQETLIEACSGVAQSSLRNTISTASAVGDEGTCKLPWSPKDDETLIQARARGLNWNQIAPKHFPSKTTKSCRKRHERLMERTNSEQWDGVKLGTLAKAYMEVRCDVWSMLASRVGKKWNLIEQKVHLWLRLYPSIRSEGYSI